MGLRNAGINLFYKAATGSKKLRTILTPVGIVFFALLTAAFVVAALWFDRWFDFPPLLEESLSIILSAPIVLFGLIIYLWTVRNFLKAKGTPVPFNPPPKVVTSGPYAYSRNPMLTSIFVMMFGLGIFLGSVALTFIFTPLYVVLHVLHIILIEEPELAKRLGGDYLEYKKSTPRFFPKLKL